VTIDDAPTVVVNNDGTECIAPTTDLMLSSTPAGGTAPYTFAWTGPNGFASIDQNPVLPNANDLMSGTYVLVITDANGCTATDQTVIDVTEGPDQPVVSNSGPHCEGNTLEVSTSAYAGNDVSYEWTGPLGSTTSGAYPNAPSFTIDPVTEASEGNYTVQVTVDGCTSLVSEINAVVINRAPTIDLSFAYTMNPDCSPSDLMLFSTVTPGDSPIRTIQWQGPNGFFSTIEDPTITDVSPLFNGSYTFFVIDESGCTVLRTIEVNGIEEEQPLPIITGTPQTCEEDEIILTIPAYLGVDVEYDWTVPGPSTNITGDNSNQLIISPVTADYAGFYSVTVTVDGCVVESPDFEVKIFDAPTVTATNDGTECIQPTTDINLVATPANGLAPYTFAWTGPNGFTSVVQNPTIPNANSAMSGTYVIEITDANGCTAIAETVIDVTAQPTEPTLTANASLLCEGEEYIITAPTYPGFNVVYDWTGPLGTTASGAYPDQPSFTINTATPADAGSYTVQVTVDGCSSVVSTEVVLDVTPTAAPPTLSNVTVCENEILQIGTLSTADEYIWTGPSGFTSDQQSPFVSAEAAGINAGIYTLVIKFGDCESAPATMEVFVNEIPETQF